MYVCVGCVWWGGGDVCACRHVHSCMHLVSYLQLIPPSPPITTPQQVHDAFAPLLLSLYHDDRRTAHKWRSSPRGTLALIVLFDQLARCVWRGYGWMNKWMDGQQGVREGGREGRIKCRPTIFHPHDTTMTHTNESGISTATSSPGLFPPSP